ncbi:MAG: aminomethyltransferase family protein [Chloroflexi bacterium]|nr:aminomethyltransferase family protein [Chloroflexota bacterium]
MTLGSPIDSRALPLNVKRQWREWSGRFASSAYAPHHDIEVNAIRNAAAVIDVSPLFKYRVAGPDAQRLVDRVITRDATKLARGQVFYTPWCDEHGKVLDDGTVHRLDDDSYRWTAADPQLRWLRLNARGLDVTIEEQTDDIAALALQGPLSRDVLEAATGESFADLRYFRRRASTVGELPIDVSRTGYTGDLGYELWVEAARATELWDALFEVGRAYALRPAGMLALDVVRIEAGLILLEVDYTSAAHALIPEQSYSPGEIGLGRLVDLDKQTPFVGRAALRREAAAGGPPRRLVGLELDWEDLERLYHTQDLTPALSAAAWREQVPVYAGERQVGRATSGTWSPGLKRNIALASVEARSEPVGTQLQMEWTVEGRRGRVAARVVPLPFFDPPHKRA